MPHPSEMWMQKTVEEVQMLIGQRAICLPPNFAD